MATLPRQSVRLLLPDADTPNIPAASWSYPAYMTAVEQSGLKAHTRWLLSRLALRADGQTGIIPAQNMPAVPELAVITGMSEQSVQRHLRLAEDRGWLAWESTR